MFCSSCGTQLEEGTLFCPNCGNPVAQANDAAQTQAEASAAQASAPVNPAPQFDGSTQYYTPQPVLGLKWAHFLGYFALWAGALVNLGSGISFITGLIYNGDASFIYDYFPGLQVLNILYGVCLLGTVALNVFAALSIIKCKKQTGLLVCLVYSAQVVLSLVYVVAGSIILSSFAGDASVVSSVIVSIVMIFVNRVYFNNRRDVYVN
ncbi:zinc-ribbon domain-containing protein [Pseudobutyrivibrio ruminis]|uniref:Zinc-ribbon domain-containing protein n=1 Tax=Pseudobutyrivibrio ruminis TaxID=46206 RepID=A0A1H7EYR9_9FIRM|nr:zinc ribbon domain-containing protein [Pseudobutyrivibrio ruminis]SEK18928.1 zinc-ribbon domain-containing protein [Pseudobutyrivibrio ruminis]